MPHILIEAAETRILIDPGVLSVDAAFELEDLDAIVVTHQHPDHLDRERIGGLLERNAGSRAAVRSRDRRARRGRRLDAAHARRRDDGRRPDRCSASAPSTPRSSPPSPASRTPGFSWRPTANPRCSIPATPTSTLRPGSTCWHCRSPHRGRRSPRRWTSSAGSPPGRCSPSTTPDCPSWAYGLYWGHVQNFGGVEDARPLGPTESTRRVSEHVTRGAHRRCPADAARRRHRRRPVADQRRPRATSSAPGPAPASPPRSSASAAGWSS